MPLLLLLIILEVIVFVLIAHIIGFLLALGLIIASTIAGIILLGTDKHVTFLNLQQKIAKGQLPLQEMMAMPFRFIAGLLLLIPGFITDIIAIICLIPQTRQALLHRLFNNMMTYSATMKNSRSHHHHTTTDQSNNNNPHTIEGEYWRHDDNNQTKQ